MQVHDSLSGRSPIVDSDVVSQRGMFGMQLALGNIQQVYHCKPLLLRQLDVGRHVPAWDRNGMSRKHRKAVPPDYGKAVCVHGIRVRNGTERTALKSVSGHEYSCCRV